MPLTMLLFRQFMSEATLLSRFLPALLTHVNAIAKKMDNLATNHFALVPDCYSIDTWPITFSFLAMLSF
eukprot:14650729-Heterocapsa_arctica.AAC.1